MMMVLAITLLVLRNSVSTFSFVQIYVLNLGSLKTLAKSGVVVLETLQWQGIFIL